MRHVIWGSILFLLLIGGSCLQAQTQVRTLSGLLNGNTLGTPPVIVVNEDGSAIVAWPEKWQYINPDGTTGTLVREEVAHQSVYALDAGRWAFLKTTDSSWSNSGAMMNRTQYFLQLRDPFADIGRTTDMFSLLQTSSLTDDPSESWTLQYLHAASHEGSYLFSATLRATITQYSGPGADWQEHRWILWQPGEEPITVDPGEPRYGSYCMSDQLLGAFSESGVPFLLQREEHDRSLTRHRLDPDDAGIVSSTVLPVLPEDCPAMIVHMEAHDDGAVDLIMNAPYMDTLIVRHFDAEGNATGIDWLCAEIRNGASPTLSSGWPDAVCLPVDGGGHLICWTRKDAPDVTRIYISAFDEHWQPLGDPRPVAVGDGVQIAPAIALRGRDTLAVAWYEKNPGWVIKYRHLPLSQFIASQPPVAVVLFTHIEDNTPVAELNSPEALVQYESVRDGLIAFAKRAASFGLRWSLQPDWKFLLAALRFEQGLLSTATNGKALLTWLRDDMDMPIDPHSHEKQGYNYSDVAHLLDSLGVGGSTVIGGHIWDPSLPQFQNWDRFRVSVPGSMFPWAVWRGDILMGSGTPNHVNDPVVSGVWRPRDRWQYFDHDAAANIVSVGQYTGDMQGLRELVMYRRSGAVPADSMLTLSLHIPVSWLLHAQDVEAVADSILRPLAAMRNRGDVLVTDFTSLVEEWQEAYGGRPCVFRPGISTDAGRPHAADAAHAMFDLYPNPASTHVTVRHAFDRTESATLSLHDALGRELLTRTLSGNAGTQAKLRLETGSLRPGVYFLRLQGSTGVTTRRLTIVR